MFAIALLSAERSRCRTRCGLSPFIIANSGSPFDIIVGQDLNGDSIFNDRPSFRRRPGRHESKLRHSEPLTLRRLPGQSLIPINYGSGPSVFSLNLRLSKSIRPRS